MPTIYRVVPRDDNRVYQFREASRVGSFMLGRRLGAYLVVKSDELGDRVINWPSNPDVFSIEEAMKSQ